MKRVLSKSLLIAIAILILFSAGCAKKATIPDTIAEVEQTWFSFREGEITYDELKEKVGGYFIDFDQKYGEEVFVQWKHHTEVVYV